MTETSLTNILDKSPFILLTLSLALVGYFRNTSIPMLLKKLKEYDEVKTQSNNLTESDFEKSNHESTEEIPKNFIKLHSEELINKKRGIHNQLIILNILQIALASLSCLIIGRFFYGHMLDIWINCLLPILAACLLVFHLWTNTRYILKSIDALKKISGF